MQKYSSKREAIMDALREVKVHPTAEWVYARLKPDYPDLSLATVYRNLKAFVDSGEVNMVGVVEDKARYDADTYPHAHFICEHCGAVVDVYLPQDNGINAMAEEAVGGKVQRQEILFRGLCENCLERE